MTPGRSLRVLITGMSSMQAGAPTRLRVVQFGALLAQALRDEGHQVEHRRAIVGEPLGERFDVALVGIGPTGTAGRLVYSAWDVIGRARAEGCALAIFLDDHKLTQIRDTIKSDLGTPVERPIIVGGTPTFATGARLVKDQFAGRRDWAWAIDHVGQLLVVGDALMSRPWPTTLIPAHSWDNHDLMLRALRFDVPRPVHLDPSAYVPEFPDLGLPGDERKRAWVSAALPDKKLSTWPITRERLGWPVHEFGAAKEGQAKPTEAEVYAWYQQNVGLIAMRRTRHDGSGWWRIRYAHAARTRSIVLATSADSTAMGEPFTVPVETIESTGTGALRDLAQAQADAYFARQWSREQFRTCLDEVIRKIASGERGPVAT